MHHTLKCIITARTQSLRQGNVLHSSVILFTGGHASPTMHTPTKHVTLPRTPHPYDDMVYEGAVRILLECILV